MDAFICNYDEDSDEVAGYDTDTLEYMEEDRCIEIMDQFKNSIKKEPEFYGIDNISSVEILHLTYMNHVKTKRVLTEFQLYLFDNMFTSIHNYSSTESNYNFIARKIFTRIYIT